MVETTTRRTTRAERLRRASRERRDLERSELRRAILDSAAALFVEQGYERFSMRQVAERIGYSATTIYRHFEDKDALLFAVVDQGFEQFRDALAAAAKESSDPRERIRALGRAYVRFGLENPAYYRMMFLQRADYLQAPPDEGGEPRSTSFDILKQAVQSAVDAGDARVADVGIASNYLWALVHGIVSLAVAGPHPDEFATAEAVDAMLELSYQGLRSS
jgi:AcrR family transcriptional regulator